VSFEDYWYVVAESQELTPNSVLARADPRRCAIAVCIGAAG
jgi:hypothetical protein